MLKELKEDTSFFLETIIFPWSIKKSENDEKAFFGKGSFGKVLRVFDTKTDKDIAIKLI